MGSEIVSLSAVSGKASTYGNEVEMDVCERRLREAVEEK